ncbi:maleylpyruvate isomerase N-terminal domain-containing protein [Mycolicibacterium stellerae]|uniref:maleylpyruvate isomerase N-terminal domain-containing protein n=1 Tax=Mycolicibacterium stellerae TaxID=2358193 RepID=UPI000F0B102B|nr:maleylpyruvate isomerase N-terminal domain-containing protein [Mycolicibacterium stellerae]
MTPSIVAVRSLIDDTSSVLGDLALSDWSIDSACRGWRVQDLVTHMAFFLNTIADPRLTLPPNPDGTTESLNDAAVYERAEWSPQRALEYYTAQAEAGFRALVALQEEPLRSKTIRLGELGTYRLAQLADAVAFDHLVHLTSDLLLPHGPVAGSASVAEAIDATIDWMLAGLPQMCPRRLHLALGDDPVGVRLVGETERAFTLSRDGDAVVLTETADLPAETATTRATDFLRWATKRSSWRPVVAITGRRELVAPILDAIRVI